MSERAGGFPAVAVAPGLWRFTDRVIGAPGGGLRLCPPSWLGYLGSPIGPVRLRDLLRPLELPVERVLVSHGQPALAGGGEALAEALE